MWGEGWCRLLMVVEAQRAAFLPSDARLAQRQVSSWSGQLVAVVGHRALEVLKQLCWAGVRLGRCETGQV
jgi:hypothetical protein